MLGMSTKVGVLTVCTVLLATLAGRVAAGPFGGESAYVALANHLHQATSSDELDDNIRQVSLLEVQQPNAGKEIRELAQLFGSLKHNVEDPASLCSKDNLSNLRQLTGAMSRHGNLGPKRITEPIRRLNMMIIKFIDSARNICGRYLASQWPITKESVQGESELARLTKRLNNGLDDQSINDIHSMGKSISSYLDIDVLTDPELPLDSASRDENYHTMNPKKLAHQVEKYLYEPCKEFVSLDVSKSVLEPYIELDKTYEIVREDNGSMGKFYESCHGYPLAGWLKVFQPYVDRSAVQYKMCNKLLTVPVSQVVLAVTQARVAETSHSLVDKTKAKASALYGKVNNHFA